MEQQYTLTTERKELDAKALENFLNYLRIRSVHPNVDYGPCVDFLQKQAKDLNLTFRVIEMAVGKPVVLMSWYGTAPELKTILLNSHMDVVPVIEEQWIHPPFAGHIDEAGRIYGRGAQDMKSVAIQYLEAIRRLKERNITLKRTVHLSFVPDEEINSKEGMEKFIQTKDFEALNIGVALDEGDPSSEEYYQMFNGEKSIWQFRIHCPGKAGHGSLLLDDTAGEKAAYVMTKIYEFRAEMVEKLRRDPLLADGDVTSINLTQIKGGCQTNILPSVITLYLDCRLSVTTDVEEFESTINQWCKEAGNSVWIEYDQKNPLVQTTKLDESNQYWVAFRQAFNIM